MTDCPPTYKNPQLESFGEQKYVTQELLQQYGCNDEYLLQLAKKIEYLTPPAVRKRFILKDSIDQANSYGCIVSGEHVELDNNLEKRVFAKVFCCKFQREQGSCHSYFYYGGFKMPCRIACQEVDLCTP